MRNTVNIIAMTVGFGFLVLGCSGVAKNDSTGNSPASNVGVVTEKPIAIDAKALTKEYDANELAADGKYKGKQLAVTGKISNIAETLGHVTVQLEGHNVVKTVLCNFEDTERPAVMKLKRGQQATLTGSNEGSTGGLYVGLAKCKAP